MSSIAIVMMVLFMLVIWGGLGAALVNLVRAGDTQAAKDIDNGTYRSER